ncbi:CoA-transferase [Mycolicibacterium farcinogenes]|uniref:CoA-transferase subunit beta n=1 Tax=Mycolicibacterium farcinogenes TaxID=1802 RepID=UPI001C8DBB19|nr:CoA-transferase [Mycolicibacterium farcinogenes]QZH60896.1 CoA-transferase [Mycolicibacterium farcinogenes]
MTQRADICVVACAESWRGAGEIVARPIGAVPTIAARLARATFSPDLLLSDGEACLVTGNWSLGATPTGATESYLPYRSVFELAWRGQGHIMMMPAQLDRFGNANLSAIGDFSAPTRQLLGVCGAPGNTVTNPTSYWVPKHRMRSFVDRVDVVCGVGYDNAQAGGFSARRYHDVRRVVTDLAVLDFDTPTHEMRLVSVHPGVTVDEVVENTGFPLTIVTAVPQTRVPSDDELRIIEYLDPNGRRFNEVPRTEEGQCHAAR